MTFDLQTDRGDYRVKPFYQCELRVIAILFYSYPVNLQIKHHRNHTVFVVLNVTTKITAGLTH